MIENRYKFGTDRLINLGLLPVFSTALIFVFLYLKFDSWRGLSIMDILFWTLYFIFFAGVYVFLFFDHLSLARETELIIGKHTFQIIQGSQSYSCNMDAVNEVIEFSAGRLPWGPIVKWIVKTRDKEFVISSLTISRSNFERHFWNKTTEINSIFPRL